MSELAGSEHPLTGDAFRVPAATTQRVTPRPRAPLPQPEDPGEETATGKPDTPAPEMETPAPMATGPVQAQVAQTLRAQQHAQHPAPPAPEAPAPSAPVAQAPAAFPSPAAESRNAGPVAPAEPPPTPRVPPLPAAAAGPAREAAYAAAPGPVPGAVPYAHRPQAGAVPGGAPAAPAPQRQQPPLSFREFQQAVDAKAPAAPAERGWRGRVRRLSGGLVSPAMSRTEALHKAATAQVQASLAGPKSIVFVNPKGGATTTTSTLMAGRTFGTLRGGGVVAWDNNETRGTLGGRARPAGHWNTARELLDNIELFENSATARIGDLGLYLRGQAGAHFDVLASDERPEVTGNIDAREVARLHALFERFYRLILVDTGNNMRAPNWLAAVERADLLVVTTTVRQDSASSALWMLDALEKNIFGPGRLKARTVTLLTAPAPQVDASMRRMMVNIFGARTRAVLPIPYDPALVDGGMVDYDRLAPATHTAWLYACAAMAQALVELPPRGQ